MKPPVKCTGCKLIVVPDNETCEVYQLCWYCLEKEQPAAAAKEWALALQSMGTITIDQ